MFQFYIQWCLINLTINNPTFPKTDSKEVKTNVHSVFIADGPLGPSALTLDNWMLFSQNG